MGTSLLYYVPYIFTQYILKFSFALNQETGLLFFQFMCNAITMQKKKGITDEPVSLQKCRAQVNYWELKFLFISEVQAITFAISGREY